MAQQLEQDITRERSMILSSSPHLVALVFDLAHIQASTAKNARLANDKNMIACTDGNTVWYGERYNELSPNEKNYVCLHELLHGIMKHPLRSQMLYLRMGYIIAVLANYAADAVINEAIDSDPYTRGGTVFRMPEKFPGIRMSTIHEIMKESIAFTKAKPPESYDPKAKDGQQMETIYSWLLWAHEQTKQKREADQKKSGGKPQQDSGSGQGQGQGQGQGEGDSDEESSSDDQQPGGQKGKSKDDAPKDDQKPRGGSDETRKGEADDGLTQIERIVKEDAWDIEQAIDAVREALKSGKTVDQIIVEVQDRLDLQREKIQQIVQGIKMQGHGKGNIMLSLENDLPEPVVPWRHIIRKQIVSGMGIKLVDSYSRPSVTTLAALGNGKRAAYRPSVSIYDRQPRVLVVLDVSGSQISSLPQCFSEIWSLAKMKDAAIDLVTFDDGIQEKMEIKDKREFNRILERGIKGGGGTELLDEVFDKVGKLKHPYKMVIVMTDGYLTVGLPQRYKGFEILWVVTPGGRGDHLAQIGKVVMMPDYMR